MKELYWAVNQWIESVEDSKSSLYPYTAGLLAANADENYVGQQLDLLEKSFLNFYRDTMLMRCLPMKLLLCSQLDWRTADNKVTTRNMYNSYDCMAFNWGNETVLTMTPEQKKAFKVDVNLAFLKRLLANGKLSVCVDFTRWWLTHRQLPIRICILAVLLFAGRNWRMMRIILSRLLFLQLTKI